MRRGFTLVEMVVVVAIIAVIAGVAAYSLYGGQTQARTIGKAREMQGALRELKATSVARSPVAGLACGAPTCLPRSVGLRFTSRTSYDVFADLDNAPGGEVVVRSVNINASEPDSKVQFGAPPDGTEIRFNNSGLLVGAGVQVTVLDTLSNDVHTIDVTPAGAVLLDGH